MNGGARGFSTSIYVKDKASFEECKRLLKLQGLSLSEEIMNFVLRRRDELKGGSGQSMGEGVDYQSLKARYSKLVSEVARKKDELSEMPYFHEANDLLAGLGLKKDFSNADELTPQFMVAWKGDVDFMQEYVTLVELARDKRQAERRLREIRTGSKKEDPGAPKAEEQHVFSEIDPSQCREIVPVCP